MKVKGLIKALYNLLFGFSRRITTEQAQLESTEFGNPFTARQSSPELGDDRDLLCLGSLWIIISKIVQMDLQYQKKKKMVVN